MKIYAVVAFLVAGGIAVLAADVVVTGPQQLTSAYMPNVATDLLGVALTIGVVDRLLKRQQVRESVPLRHQALVDAMSVLGELQSVRDMIGRSYDDEIGREEFEVACRTRHWSDPLSKDHDTPLLGAMVAATIRDALTRWGQCAERISGHYPLIAENIDAMFRGRFLFLSRFADVPCAQGRDELPQGGGDFHALLGETERMMDEERASVRADRRRSHPRTL